MAKEYKSIDYIEDGRVNYIQLNKNFASISADINTIIDDIVAVQKTTGLLSLSVLCEEEGYVTIAPSRIHPNMRLTSGYIVAGDNIKETINIKVLYGNKERNLANGTIKGTEKAGKAHSLSIKEREIVQRLDEVVVYTDNRRKAIVNLAFEVTE